MNGNPQTYEVEVDQFLVDRNDLSLVGRIAAVATGRWPKVLLHKVECPCCGKVTFHRAVEKNGRRSYRDGNPGR